MRELYHVIYQPMLVEKRVGFHREKTFDREWRRSGPNPCSPAPAVSVLCQGWARGHSERAAVRRFGLLSHQNRPSSICGRTALVVRALPPRGWLRSATANRNFSVVAFPAATLQNLRCRQHLSTRH